MADQDQNPGRKWRQVENDGDGNKYFDNFRFTPFTTDLEFFRDPNIYGTEVARTTQKNNLPTDSEKGPRGNHRPDERIKEEIDGLLTLQRQFVASGVQVNVEDGVVTLSGSVADQYAKQTAGNLIENVFGVREVNNHLNVSG